jgi:hypothetical protein
VRCSKTYVLHRQFTAGRLSGKFSSFAVYAENGNFDEAIRWQKRVLEDPRYRDDAAMHARLEVYRGKQAYREN